MKKVKETQYDSNQALNQIKQIRYFLVFVVLLISSITLNHQYNLDDDLVTNNHPITSKGISAVGEIFTTSYFVDNMGHSYGYRPIVLLSFAIEHEIFGDNPAVGHLINIILYLITSLLIFKLLRKLLGEKGIMFAGIAALIFAIHPIHSEVLSSLKNRDELLALLFSLLAGISVLNYTETSKNKSIILSIIYFSIALLAKKSVFPLVLIFPLMVLLFRKINFNRYLFIVLGLMIPAILIGSELNPHRMLLLFVVISLINLVGYFIILPSTLKNTLKKDDVINVSRKEQFFFYGSLLMITMVALTSVILKSPYLMVLSLPFLFISSFKNYHNLLFAFSVMLISYSAYFSIDWLGKYGAIILLWLGFQSKPTIRYLLKIEFVLTIIGSLIYIVAPEFLLNNLIFILTIGFVVFMLNYGIVFKILSLAIYGVFTFYNYDSFIVYILPLLYLLNWLNPLKSLTFLHLNTDKYFYIRVILALTIFIFSFSNYFSLDKKMRYDTKTSIAWQSNNTVKEGRPLTFIENTLVKDTDFESRVATGVYTIGTYFRLMVAPVNLSYYYGYSKITTKHFSDVSVWISILAYLGLFSLGWWKRKSNTLLVFGILWFSISIFMFSNWFELIAGMVAERLTFTASVGFSIFIASLITWLIPDFNLFKPRGKMLMIFGVFGLLAIMTIHRNYLWKDREILMSHDIEYLDKSVQAHNLYALGLMNLTQQGNYPQNRLIEMKQKALFHLTKALDIYPSFFNAQFDRGRILTELGDFKNANIAFKKALEISPNSPIALEEIIKTAFELKMHSEVYTYGLKYIENNSNELIFELVAYSCLLNHDFEHCLYFAQKGLKLFPQNPNFSRMIIDANNKVIL